MAETDKQEIVNELTATNGAGDVTTDTELVPASDIPKFRIPPEPATPSAPYSGDGRPSASESHPILPDAESQVIPEYEIIEPIENHVFIRPDQASGRSPSGTIILPDSVKEATAERGEVLYVGPGIEVEGKFNRTKVSRGDRIIFHRHSGTAVMVNGEELICMREPGVFGILRARETVGSFGMEFKDETAGTPALTGEDTDADGNKHVEQVDVSNLKALEDLKGHDPLHVSMIEQGTDGVTDETP